ncbi:MAG TPA: Hpt domain-containing protein, partial [Ktedonobacteraceae bacterium]|nr:Hpt domain-containing protein [Ktedonobacteraceae bacterium]
MSNTFDKISVLDSFIEEVNSYLPEIETNLERLTQSPGDMDALEETYRRTHTIGGSASMMDFPGLAHVAHGMEDVLADALDGLISLDEAALGLLRRSLGRLHQLLQGIRSGIDEESVIAEDDADYARYRAVVEAAGATSSAVQDSGGARAVDVTEESQTQVTPAVTPTPVEMSPSLSSTVPSFDEVLASFRTPLVNPGEEVAWPEDPVDARLENVALPQPETGAGQSDVPASLTNQALSDVAQTLPTDALQAQLNRQTALEELMASTRSVSPETSFTSKSPSGAVEYPVMPSTSRESDLPTYSEMNRQLPVESSLPSYTPGRHIAEEEQRQLEQDESKLPQIYDEMRKDAQAVVSQASSLTGVVAQLRQAMAVIETQRGEFKGFLSGSKDALERMEDWAGQAMGLNLRNSPEQVRRYLPLSVMWVANSKLKKALDLLGKIASGVEMTDEQIASNLHQLYGSIHSFGQVFQEWEEEHSSHGLRQEGGWSPWEMQVMRDSGELRERVTFERQGDLAALR